MPAIIVPYHGRMLGEVIEAAAELADMGEPTVTAALRRYQLLPVPPGRQGQVWISVAFMIDKHVRLAALLPRPTLS